MYVNHELLLASGVRAVEPDAPWRGGILHAEGRRVMVYFDAFLSVHST